ncbi:MULTISPECIES: hypothetical protein [unclassified Nostoc]|uniref:hypothetical protein n=1 Tax=unclassified Nostoc TaxID=2593658 RepID=UPI0025E669AD|nr:MULTISPECIES: hypothetical protein [unclassified Nostoc]
MRQVVTERSRSGAGQYGSVKRRDAINRRLYNNQSFVLTAIYRVFVIYLPQFPVKSSSKDCGIGRNLGWLHLALTLTTSPPSGKHGGRWNQTLWRRRCWQN